MQNLSLPESCAVSLWVCYSESTAVTLQSFVLPCVVQCQCSAQQIETGFYFRQSAQSIGAVERWSSKRAMTPVSALIIPDYLECPAGCCQGRTGCTGVVAATAKAKGVPQEAVTAALAVCMIGKSRELLAHIYPYLSPWQDSALCVQLGSTGVPCSIMFLSL